MSAALKQRALASVGTVARYVPHDGAQIFSFVASPKVRSDPWALYQRLHRSGAIRQGPYGIWLIASHAAVTQVLREAPTTVDESYAELPGGPATDSDFSRLMERTLLFTDPPDHTRLRRLVSRSFTPRTVDALRDPRARSWPTSSIAELKDRGPADLVTELALPVPGRGDRRAARSAQPKTATASSPGPGRIAPRLDISLFRDDAVNEAGNRGARELTPTSTTCSTIPTVSTPMGCSTALVSVEDDGDRLSRDELIALCGLLLLAGFETTTNLVANSIHTLLGQPERSAAIRDGDVDMRLAVDELLRHDGPVQFAQRVLLEDTEIGGQVLPAKTLAALLIGAANRDPLVFDRPDDLVLDRKPTRTCASHRASTTASAPRSPASKARSPSRPSCASSPTSSSPGDPEWRRTFVLRGFTELPVRWRAVMPPTRTGGGARRTSGPARRSAPPRRWSSMARRGLAP